MSIVNWIYNHNTKRYCIATAVIALIGMTLIFTQYFGAVTLADEKALDMLYFYNQSTFYDILHSLTKSDRFAYKLIHLADYVFIMGFYPLIAFGLSKVISKENKLATLVLLPLIAADFDILENFMMDIHLYLYPTEILFLGSIAGVFTTFKFVCLFVSIIFLVLWRIKKWME